ncbi:MAG: DUF6807 family protein [Planctomycetota bacterium]
MMRHTHVLAGLLILFAAQTGLWGQSLTVNSSRFPQHIHAELPAADCEPSAQYSLVDASDPQVRLPAQITPAVADDGTTDPSAYQLVASVPGTDQEASRRSFRLEKGSKEAGKEAFAFEKDDLSVELMEVVPDPARPIWRYNHGTIVKESVPESDPRRSRACYIHPVWGMHGEILTDDFPQDHYHHHGIFWTWPYVNVGGQTYDLWMSSDIQQRFVKWLSTETGPVAAVMGVENGWFVGQQQVATERVWVRTYRSEPDCRAVDLTLYIEAGDKPVTLKGRQKKSYGGLTFRFDVSPRKDATVRIPGKALGHGAGNQSGNPDLLNTPLPWADLTTRIPGSPRRSGAAVFIHPRHPDYPPTWLTRTYGPLCVGWPGVESHTIQPGESVKLQYRIWVHAEELDFKQIEQRYKAYRQSRAIEDLTAN